MTQVNSLSSFFRTSSEEELNIVISLLDTFIEMTNADDYVKYLTDNKETLAVSPDFIAGARETCEAIHQVMRMAKARYQLNYWLGEDAEKLFKVLDDEILGDDNDGISIRKTIPQDSDGLQER